MRLVCLEGLSIASDYVRSLRDDSKLLTSMHLCWNHGMQESLSPLDVTWWS